MDLFFGRVDPTVPATESSQVKSFLAAVRIKTDDTARMEPVGVVQNPWHGSIRVYHLHAVYHGQHLRSEIVDGPLSFTCDLTCRNARELSQQRQGFESLVRSVSIRNVRK